MLDHQFESHSIPGVPQLYLTRMFDYLRLSFGVGQKLRFRLVRLL